MSAFTIVTSTHGVESHTLDFSTPLLSLTNWALMLQRHCPHVVRYEFEEADTSCEVEEDNIRFGIYKDGTFLGFSEWISLSFFKDAFRNHSHAVGLNFLEGDQEVIVENNGGSSIFIEVPEVDFEEISESTTYGNGPIESELQVMETGNTETTLHMAYRLELLPNMVERLFCVLSLDHGL